LDWNVPSAQYGFFSLITPFSYVDDAFAPAQLAADAVDIKKQTASKIPSAFIIYLDMLISPLIISFDWSFASNNFGI
jgi:hypothetical protein